MKPFVYFLLILLIPLNFTCTGFDSFSLPPFKMNELNGNWAAYKAKFIGNGVAVDVFDGGTMTMYVQSHEYGGGADFTLTINPKDRNPYSVTGEMFWSSYEQIHNFSIVWDKYPDEIQGYGYGFDGTLFSLTGPFEYDFDNDGNFEECSIDFGFIRI